MNINALSKEITIRNNPFYLNEFLKPFISAYISKSDKIDCEWNLLHHYIFGNCAVNEYRKHKKFYSSEVFIGYRWFANNFVPFFVSIRNYDDFLEVSGFSTFTEEDYNKNYYLNNIDLGPSNSKKFPVKILSENRSSANDDETLLDRLKNIGDITSSHI